GQEDTEWISHRDTERQCGGSAAGRRSRPACGAGFERIHEPMTCTRVREFVRVRPHASRCDAAEPLGNDSYSAVSAFAFLCLCVSVAEILCVLRILCRSTHTIVTPSAATPPAKTTKRSPGTA